MKIEIRLSILFFILIMYSCKEKETLECQTTSQEPPSDHLEYFGFTLIDVYWDDPMDEEVKTVYNDEVHEFSNIADMLVVTPEDDLVSRFQDMNDLDMRPFLHLNEIFFELVSTDSPSGAAYDLRSDYQARWDGFVDVNNLEVNYSMLECFYIGEEPTWNGIDYEELSAATDYVKSTIPEVPILVVEAYPAIDDLVVPESVDWIGFDHYFIMNPMTSEVFQSELMTLKTKFSTEDQRLMIIMDTHFIPWAHGDFGNISEEDMKEVATNYFELAKSEPKAIGIIGYTWPGGFDSEDMLGARQLSDETQEEYRRIGKEITGKP